VVFYKQAVFHILSNKQSYVSRFNPLNIRANHLTKEKMKLIKLISKISLITDLPNWGGHLRFV